MEFILIILLVCVLAGLGTVIFLLTRKKEDTAKRDQESLFQEMKQEMESMRGDMRGSLEKNLEFVQQHAGHSHKVITEVTSKLERLESTNKQVVGFTEQLQNLQKVLTNPKQRGVLGEYYLETLLQSVLPVGSYKMQYRFNDGEIVDAAIFDEKIIPIDSKFSLENYNRLTQEEDPERRTKLEQLFKQDLKKRIDETAKYVRPSENTYDYAFMFIPAEGIYYDLLVSQVGTINVSTRDLIEYAHEKHVLIVSPNSFYAYLQTVLHGQRARQIQESAQEIRKNVGQLGKHLQTYETYMQKLGNNLGTTVNMYNNAYKEFGKVDKDIMRIAEEGVGADVISLDRPKTNT